jgi:hypothetical protein
MEIANFLAALLHVRCGDRSQGQTNATHDYSQSDTSPKDNFPVDH